MKNYFTDLLIKVCVSCVFIFKKMWQEKVKLDEACDHLKQDIYLLDMHSSKNRFYCNIGTERVQRSLAQK